MIRFEDGKFNKHTAKKIIKYLIKKYNITLDNITPNQAIGKANIIQRHITIPTPNTPEKFFVALHEIGHIVKGYGSKLYITEYKAEIFAIEEARKSGLKEIYIKRYEKIAKAYVLMAIAKGYRNHLNLDKLNKKIINWIGYNDFNRWKNKEVYIHDWKWNKDTCNITLRNLKENIVEKIYL